MKRCYVVFFVLLLVVSPCLAGTSSHGGAADEQAGWIIGPGHAPEFDLESSSNGSPPLPATILIIETYNYTKMDEALTALGLTFDYYFGDDFSAIDLSSYEHVYVTMDGGYIEEPSIANVASYVHNGGKLHFYGGTSIESFSLAVDAYLIGVDTTNDYWTMVGGTPHSTVVNAASYLANGLPATYNFVDIQATYYQTRTTDPELGVAAVNGDGYNHLFYKMLGDGRFDWCINSPYENYYYNPDDFAWLTQVVANMYWGSPNDVLLIETTDSAVEEALISLGVGYDYFFGPDWSAVDLHQYEHVIVAMDGGDITETSIINASIYAHNGGHLHFYGGSALQTFAEYVNAHLILNDTMNYYWTRVSGAPHSYVRNHRNYLTMDLPNAYDFNDDSASYYQTRITDPHFIHAAINGDGYEHLFAKHMYDNGTFDWCTNSPHLGYYMDPADFDWLRTVVRNMIFMPQPEPLVWSGRTYPFAKADYVDWNDPRNQDRISCNVVLTRPDTQGLFNISQEASPDNWGLGSPLDTEWAVGDAENWESLDFMTWLEVCDTYPCYYLVGVDLCLHLKSENIYLDIRFDSWTCGGGGGFSYARAVPPPRIWSGRTHYFEKLDWTDWTQIENQDRITDCVWLTRKDIEGLFNIAQEPEYLMDFSPEDTEWATGNAEDWEYLTFYDWRQWADYWPCYNIVGVDAVVHLISANIYIDIRFESWTCGGMGGGFSYYRGRHPTPADENPVIATKLMAPYPNPFNPETTVSFAIAEKQAAKVQVIDVLGRVVKTLYDGTADAGRYEVVWDGTDENGVSQASGVYLIQMRTDTTEQTAKTIMLK